MDPTLLATKLYPPPVPRAQVVRLRLSARLDELLRPGARLGLLCAATGFGKTTLVTSWLSERMKDEGGRLNPDKGGSELHPSSFSLEPSRVAWLSLDPADDDPARFWAYLIGAFQVALPDLATVIDPAQLAPLPAELLLSSLLNCLASRPPCLLVLDDYHLIASPAIHAGLAFLIDHQPPTMRVILTSRTDPPLPLSRWRARGELVELRAADLRFALDEAEHFLVSALGLPLARPEVATLAARTEGWIAGLQLAATALHDRADPAHFVAAFAGSHRFVIDYLAEEVLAQRPPHLQAFLLQTAILDRMCGPLCDAVMGVAGPEGQWAEAYSQLILAELDRLNLFLIPLDDERRWYRYHHLFVEVLRARLSAGSSAAQRAELYRRASRWFAQQGLIPEAIDYALRGEEWDGAVELIEAHAITAVLGRYAGALDRWIRALPPEVRRTSPRLLVAQAWDALAMARFAALAQLLDDAEAAADAPGGEVAALRDEITILRAAQRLNKGDVQAVTVAKATLERLPAAHPAHRAVTGWLGKALLSIGDLGGAERMLTAALADVRELRVMRIALLALLASVRLAQGRLGAGVELCQEALRLADHDGHTLPIPGATLALINLGIVSLERNDRAAAERHLRAAADLADQHDNAPMARLAAFYLALLPEADGDYAEALRQVERVLAPDAAPAVPMTALREVAGYRTLLLIRLGRIDAATAWTAARPNEGGRPPVGVWPYDRMARAYLPLAQGRYDEAGREIAALRAAAERGGQGRITLWAGVLEARRRAALGDLPAACAALDAALARAEPEGFVRVFLNEGTPMTDLLAAYVAGGGPHQPYAARLLEAGRPRPPAPAPRPLASHLQPSALSPKPLSEPISERELEVLRLIAAGRSNQQIADDLIIAVGTVKKHINNIYGKLDVGSRTQALARARESGLL